MEIRTYLASLKFISSVSKADVLTILCQIENIFIWKKGILCSWRHILSFLKDIGKPVLQYISYISMLLSMDKSKHIICNGINNVSYYYDTIVSWYPGIIIN